MISFIKKYVFSGKTKSATAAHIFLILCFYAAFTTVYAYFVVDLTEMFFRLVSGAIILACFVICERIRINPAITAFLSPAFIVSMIYLGAIHSGDVLVFIYMVGCAMFSLTYLKPRSLLFYLLYNLVVGAVLVFALKINLLGGIYTTVHNAIFFIAAIALSLLVYVFCISYKKTIDNLVEAENKAALAAKAKGNFLARMSHEIRTPLNAIVGLTETQLRKDLGGELQEVLAKIQSSGNLLLGIINDILDLSKIESGRFDLAPEEYVTADLLGDISNLNAVRIGHKPIRFVLDVDKTVPCRLVGDGLRIKQLLSNMLSNAFKYTNAGTVTLKVGWEKVEQDAETDGAALLEGKKHNGGFGKSKGKNKNKDLSVVGDDWASQNSDGDNADNHSESERIRLVFRVIDTGIGMSAEEQSRLFSEYSQVNRKANKAVEGTGLGLSICKWLVGLMGGKISVESEPGKGSTFTAEIVQEVGNPNPLGRKNAEALGSFTYAPELNETVLEFVQMPNGRVLVVDDVEMNLLVAEALMEPYGMKIDLLGSGAAAVERIKSGDPRYDLVLMDHMMPEMDGIEAVAAIRALDSAYAKSVPIVALSANAIAGSEKMFLDGGFQGFVAKPIDTFKLDSTLRKYVLKK